jgi:hypothetical protein
MPWTIDRRDHISIVAEYVLILIKQKKRGDVEADFDENILSSSTADPRHGS